MLEAIAALVSTGGARERGDTPVQQGHDAFWELSVTELDGVCSAGVSPRLDSGNWISDFPGACSVDVGKRCSARIGFQCGGMDQIRHILLASTHEFAAAVRSFCPVWAARFVLVRLELGRRPGWDFVWAVSLGAALQGVVCGGDEVLLDPNVTRNTPTHDSTRNSSRPSCDTPGQCRVFFLTREKVRAALTSTSPGCRQILHIHNVNGSWTSASRQILANSTSELWMQTLKNMVVENV